MLTTIISMQMNKEEYYAINQLVTGSQDAKLELKGDGRTIVIKSTSKLNANILIELQAKDIPKEDQKGD